MEARRTRSRQWLHPASGVRPTGARGEFGYLVDRLVDVDDLQLDQTRYPPGFALPPHVHERHMLGLTITGCVWNRTRHGELAVGPGSVFVLPAWEPHHARCDPGTVAFSIELGGRWLGDAGPVAFPSGGPSMLPPGASAARAARLYRSFWSLTGAPDLCLESQVIDLLETALPDGRGREGERVPHWLRRAREMVAELAGSTLRLQHVAREVGVHPVHLSRSFRRYYGRTMGDYLQERRIELARRALLSTEMTVSAIAHSTGFCDHSHLTRVFRKHVGVAPSTYRNAFGPAGRGARWTWSPASECRITAIGDGGVDMMRAPRLAGSTP